MRRDHLIPPTRDRMHVALDTETVATRVQQIWVRVAVEAWLVVVVGEEVAPEHTRVFRELKVRAPDDLLFDAVIWNHERITATSVRIVRRISDRDEFSQFECERAEQRRINLIVD